MLGHMLSVVDLLNSRINPAEINMEKGMKSLLKEGLDKCTFVLHSGGSNPAADLRAGMSVIH